MRFELLPSIVFDMFETGRISSCLENILNHHALRVPPHEESKEFM